MAMGKAEPQPEPARQPARIEMAKRKCLHLLLNIILYARSATAPATALGTTGYGFGCSVKSKINDRNVAWAGEP